MKCRVCRAEISPDSHFCPQCGGKVEPRGEERLSETRSLARAPGGREAGDLIGGRYKILNPAGEGGMGVVYKAEDTRLRRAVALKFLPAATALDPDAKKRFLREAQAAASLDHPNICPLYEIDEAGGEMFLTMAFVEGRSLKDRIAEGRLSVAEAGKSGRLHKRSASAWLAVLLVGLCTAAFLADKATVVGNEGLFEKPEALEKVARDLVDDLGYDPRPKDRAYGFEFAKDYLWSLRLDKSLATEHKGPGSAEQPGMYFWYRQSPDDLIPVARYSWVVSADDPRPTQPGMAGLRLKGNGDLVEFYALPFEDGDPKGDPEDLDWERIFESAGLDRGEFKEIADEDFEEPLPFVSHRRYIWKRLSPEGGNEFRVEGASYQGSPVYFKIVGQAPPTQKKSLGIPPSDRQPKRIEEARAREWTYMLVVLIAAAFVARRSLRLGRSDRKSSFRLGLFIFSFNLLAWLLEASHVPSFPGELSLVVMGLSSAMFYAIHFGLVYLAFEPYIRRFWPTLLISWNRLTIGRFRDPSVGRDLLVGAALGVWFWPVQEYLTVLAPDWLGPVRPFWRTLPETLVGGRHLPATGLFCLSAVGVSLFYLLALVLLRILLKKWWLWAPVFIIQGALFFNVSDFASIARWVGAAAMITALLLLMTRLGLLATIAFFSPRMCSTTSP